MEQFKVCRMTPEKLVRSLHNNLRTQQMLQTQQAEFSGQENTILLEQEEILRRKLLKAVG